MPSNRRKARMIAALAFALLANGAVVAPSTAGPISDMIARHRQARATKVPPMARPFAGRTARDPGVKTAGLADRFKKRFNVAKGGGDGAFKDQGVVKTSR